MKLVLVSLVACILAGCTTTAPNISAPSATDTTNNVIETANVVETTAQKITTTETAPTSDVKVQAQQPSPTDNTLVVDTTTTNTTPTPTPTNTETATTTNTAWNTDKILALAQCLTKKGAVFYGTQRCSHCQNQKKMFGDAMSAVTFVDCDAQADKCSQVQWYPTWIFADGSKAVGTQSLEALAQKASCEF